MSFACRGGGGGVGRVKGMLVDMNLLQPEMNRRRGKIPL